MDEDREDLPANWRSVVDPNTGRTYWYHRKTRISTWTKPACLNDVPAQSVPAQNVPASKVEETRSKPKSVPSTQTQQPKQLSLSESIDRSLANNDNANLQLLMSYIKPINPKAVASQQGLISSLVNIVIQTKLTAARQAGLRCLWSLTRDRKCVATHFHANQSWVSLVNHYHKWEDVESVLMLASCLSNLLVGRATYSLVTAGTKEALLGYLDRIFASTDLQSSSNNSTAVNVELFLNTNSDAGESEPLVSAASFQLYSVLISHGHTLPAMLSLVLISQSFRVEKWIVSLVKVGAVAVLQSICTSPLMDQIIKDKARQCLLSAMARSSFVRERIMESLLDMSSDLSSVPLAMGPDPALFTSINTMAAVDEEERQREADQGYYEITEELVEGEGDPPQMRNRDVEWIPLSGTAWALSSSVLWCRCPALREVIDSFWSEGRGAGLELSIDASDETLASLVKYIHCGLLLLPTSLDRQLELLRVSSELDMFALYLAMEAHILLNLTASNVAQVIDFARTLAFPNLEASAQAFVRGGAKPVDIIRFDEEGRGSSVLSGPSAAGGKAAGVLNEHSSNATLRDAIYASLQDVEDALVDRKGAASDPNKPPSPLSKNQLMQAAAAAKLVKTLQMDHRYSYNEAEEYQNISMEDILQDRLTSGPITATASPTQKKPQPQTQTQTQQQPQSQQQSRPQQLRDSHPSLLPVPVARKQHSYREEDLADPTEEQEDGQIEEQEEEEEDYEMMQSSDYYTGLGDVSRMTLEDQSVEYDPDSSYKLPVSYHSRGGKSSSSSGAASGAPKSGGIYGLLLKESGRSHTGSVPGRLPPEANNNRRSSTNNSGFGSSASTERSGSTKPSGAGAKSDTSATPRTARATSLLAGARPSGGNSYLAAYQEEQQQQLNRMASGSIDGYNSEEDGVGDFNGATEYQKQMSLAPAREMSEREKKLHEMAKPRQVAAPKKKPTAKATKEAAAAATAAEEEGEVGTDEQPSLEIIQPVTSNNNKKQQQQAAAPKKSSTAPAASATAAPLVVPKRSSSPAPLSLSQEAEEASRREQAAFNSANSLDDHSSSTALATPGSAVSPLPTAEPSAAASGFTVDPNVRGSLTLLKNKAGSRRRRSVAEVDVNSSTNINNNNDGDDYSSGSNTPTPHTTTASNAFHSGTTNSNVNGGGSVSGVAASGPKVVSVDLSAMMMSDQPSTVPTSNASAASNKPPARKPMSLSSLMGLQSAAAEDKATLSQQHQQMPSRAAVAPPVRGHNNSNSYYNQDEDEEEEEQQESQYQTNHYNNQRQNTATTSAKQSSSSSRGGYGGYDDEDEYGNNGRAAAGDDPYGEEDTGERLTCPDCGRQFAEGPYGKHVSICAKVFLNKRKAFDSAKMRMEAIPELQELQQQQQKKNKKGGGKGNAATAASSAPPPAVATSGGTPSKWKEQSNAFRDAMKAARQYKQAQATGAPLPPVQLSAPDPSLIQCPHCSRRFNDKAAERHIPHCQTAKNKPNTLKKGSGVNAASGTANVAAAGGNKNQIKGGVKW